MITSELSRTYKYSTIEHGPCLSNWNKRRDGSVFTKLFRNLPVPRRFTLRKCLADICKLLLMPEHVSIMLVKHFSDRPIQDQATNQKDKEGYRFSSGISSELPGAHLTEELLTVHIGSNSLRAMPRVLSFIAKREERTHYVYQQSLCLPWIVFLEKALQFKMM